MLDIQLFDTPALEPENCEALNYQALGISAEHLLTARLLELGHKVAVPVTDDDGVDLVVNYRLLVQVKSTARRTKNGAIFINLSNRRSTERRQQKRGRIQTHVDVLAVYARDSRRWWFVPREHIPNHAIQLREFAHPWAEAWHVFDALEGGTLATGADDA